MRSFSWAAALRFLLQLQLQLQLHSACDGLDLLLPQAIGEVVSAPPVIRSVGVWEAKLLGTREVVLSNVPTLGWLLDVRAGCTVPSVTLRSSLLASAQEGRLLGGEGPRSPLPVAPARRATVPVRAVRHPRSLIAHSSTAGHLAELIMGS